MDQLVILALVSHCVEDIKEELLTEQLHPVLAGHLRKDRRVITKPAEAMCFTLEKCLTIRLRAYFFMSAA